MPSKKGKSIIYIIFFISLFFFVTLTIIYLHELKKRQPSKANLTEKSTQDETPFQKATSSAQETKQQIKAQTIGTVLKIDQKAKKIYFKELESEKQSTVNIKEQTKIYTTIPFKEKKQVPQRQEININDIQSGDIITINIIKKNSHVKEIIYIENVN